MDRELRLRSRAEQVAALLEDLWGDAPPPGDDPRLTLVTDAIAGDDETGRAAQVVVHGDGLTYRVLAEILLDAGPRSRAVAAFPARLRERLAESGLLADQRGPAS